MHFGFRWQNKATWFWWYWLQFSFLSCTVCSFTRQSPSQHQSFKFLQSHTVPKTSSAELNPAVILCQCPWGQKVHHLANPDSPSSFFVCTILDRVLSTPGSPALLLAAGQETLGSVPASTAAGPSIKQVELHIERRWSVVGLLGMFSETSLGLSEGETLIVPQPATGNTSRGWGHPGILHNPSTPCWLWDTRPWPGPRAGAAAAALRRQSSGCPGRGSGVRSRPLLHPPAGSGGADTPARTTQQLLAERGGGGIETGSDGWRERGGAWRNPRRYTSNPKWILETSCERVESGS